MIFDYALFSIINAAALQGVDSYLDSRNASIEAQRQLGNEAFAGLRNANSLSALNMAGNARQACCKGCGAPRNGMTCDYCKRAD